jgi:sugar/nucleoside kinase (ribokinase family)
VTIPRIVCIGDLLVDVSVHVTTPLALGSDTPARITVQCGGQAANVAAWLRAAGVAATLVARVGADAFGAYLRAELTAAGIDLRLTADPQRRTGTCVVLVGVDGERTMLPDPGANAGAAEIPAAALDGAALLYVSGYALLREQTRPAAQAAIAAARARKCPIAVDAASAAPLAAAEPPGLPGWLDGPVLLFANAAEATVLLGRPDEQPAAVTALAQGYGEAVLTAGDRGAWWSDGVRVEHAAAEAATVRDTTGAGDAFAAGTLAARAGGATPAAALHAGALLAARAVELPGASPPAPPCSG